MKTYQVRQKALTRLLGYVYGLVALIGMGAVAIRAQDGVPKRGFQPAGSYAISDIESISLTSGNLTFNLPIGTLPPGRGGLSAKLNLLYNSKLFDSHPNWTTYFQGSNEMVLQQNLLEVSDGGWRYGVGYSIQTINRMDQYIGVVGLPPGTNPTPQCPSVEAIRIHKLSVVFPDGSSHEMRPAGPEYDDYQDDGFYHVRFDGFLENCGSGSWLTNTKLTYFSVDGTYLRLEIDLDSVINEFDDPWTLYFPDGTRYTAGSWPGNQPARIYDRNDNYVEIIGAQYNGHPAVKLRDGLNREVILEYNSGPSEDSIHQTGYGGQMFATRIKWKTITVNKTYYTSDVLNETPPFVETFGQLFSVVDRIILPQPGAGLDYTFGYTASTGGANDGWGEVNSITLPTGNVTERAKAIYQYRYDPSQVGANPIKWSDVLHEQSPISKVLTYQTLHDGQPAGASESWTYDIHPGTGLSSVTAPDNGMTTEFFDPVTSNGWPKGLVNKTIQPDGTITERVWKQNIPNGFLEAGAPNVNTTGTNVYVKTEYITKSLTPSSPQATDKTAVKDYKYDKNGNLLEVHEYNWVNYSTVHSGGAPSGLPSASDLKKVTVNTYHADTPEASSSYAGGDAYNKTTAPRVVRLIKSMEARLGTALNTALARTEYDYDNITTAGGNLTFQRSWDSTKGAINRPLTSGTHITVQHVYGSYGNRVQTYDPNSTRTEFTYDANGLYLTKSEVAFGQAVKRTTEYQYDQSTGLVTLTKDTENTLISKTTYDVYGRPTLVEEADGQSIERQTTTEYSDELRRVIVRSDLRTTGDQKLVTVQHYDQLGRLGLSRTMEPGNDPYNLTSGIKAQTRYAYISGNRYELASNPYRTDISSGPQAVESSMGWTMTKYDQGGRVIEVKTFSGATLPSPFGSGTNSTGTVTSAYNLEKTTVTDQAGKTRESIVDGLGRLTRVTENPNGPLNYQTNYSYDALGNLLTVSQAAQTRTFVYDSLSRLSSATMPEFSTSGGGYGSIAYLYDNNSNLSKKTDARGVTTDYTYDKLNRPVTRIYSTESSDPVAIAAAAASPQVTFYYDNQALPSGGPGGFSRGSAWGRLVAVTYGSGGSLLGSFYGHDIAGRVTSSVQLTTSDVGGPVIYAFSYEYSVGGQLKKETYPSGRVVEHTYDDAARMNLVKGTVNGSVTTFAQSFQYTPHGGVQQYQQGNALWAHTKFNSRLQVERIGLGKSSSMETTDAVSALRLGYNYGATTNNGNLQSQEVTVNATTTPTVITQTYAYDEVNRLTSYSENSTLAQSFGYDACGNRWVTSSPVPDLIPVIQSHFSSSSNRINMTGYPYGYDLAGNITTMPQIPEAPLNRTLNYDGENRIVSTKLGSGGALDYYYYDGEGKRIRKKVGGAETVFVYDASGKLVAEYSSAPPTANTRGTRYLTADHLGSTRLVTTGGAGNVKERFDYRPFGEELGAGISGRTTAMGYSSASETLKQKFVGYERDNETGLDFVQARYYGSVQGRFTSVDPVTVTPARVLDPQQLNLYAYVRNNPLAFIDPTGMIIDTSGLNEKDLKKWKKIAELANATDKDGNYSNPKLHELYEKLSSDNRTFFIDNTKLGASTAGKFEITKFDGTNNFGEAILHLDFKKIEAIDRVTKADSAEGFNKFEGLLGGDKKIHRIAEVFGHEAGHGVYALDNIAESVQLQKLLNSNDAAMRALPMKGRYPLPPDLQQKIADADRRLIPTERYAQQAEKIINGELRASSQKKK